MSLNEEERKIIVGLEIEKAVLCIVPCSISTSNI